MQGIFGQLVGQAKKDTENTIELGLEKIASLQGNRDCLKISAISEVGAWGIIVKKCAAC